MSSYKDLLKETFENKFSMDRYKNFIVQFFNNTKIVRPDYKYQDYWNWSEYSYYINGFIHVADYTDPDNKKIAIFAVELKKGKSLEKARSKQRNFIADRIKQENYDGAITAFYSEDENETKWRLSFVRLDYEFLKGKVKATFTPAKRYSYLVGKGEPCHTAMEQLFPILQDEKFNPTIDKIEEAFSVERVTKQFFEKYREKYFELKEFLLNNKAFIEEAQRCIKSEDEEALEKFTEQFSKKLMGQIAFMYFLQKKGWMGVKAIPQTITEKEYKDVFFYNALTRKFADKLYVQSGENEYKIQPSVLRGLTENEEVSLASAVKGNAWGTGPKDFVRILFDQAIKNKQNYFEDYLEPLFYQALNEKRPANNYYNRLHCRIPFLNGGLFEPYYDWENNNFSIPNEIFSNKDIKGERDADGILDVFDRYNFTMNEDEPLEKEVAVDPEMLGKIFENLLDAKDRKSKGAFYTPREIVHYMCQESLINYLVNSCNLPYEDTKEFILYGEIMKDEDCSRETKQGIASMLMPETIYKKLKEIDNALADVRVADPAVGSGAFPMGMINEIVKARDIITEYRARDIEIEGKKKGISDQQINFLKAKEHSNRNLYNLKRDTMFNSIYAVDIEPSAVDIAKLRLWLSLVVEFEVSANEPNPPTLPNLDCHIMCGNSLIDEFEKIKLFDDNILNGNGDLISSFYTETFEQLYQAERNYFYAQNHNDKRRFKQEIEDLKLSILQSALSVATKDIQERFKETRDMPSKPYMLWKLEFSKVFKDKGGFDIVIGNPPYVQIKQISNQDKLRYVKKYKFATGRFNLFYLFIELASRLGHANSNSSFIVPDRILLNTQCNDIRKWLIEDQTIQEIICFDESVFEQAVVDSIILSYNNIHNMNSLGIKIKPHVKLGELYTTTANLLDYKNILNSGTHQIDVNFDQTSNNIKMKMMSNSVQLATIAEIKDGIIQSKIPDLLFLTYKKDNFCKPLLFGRDINRFEIHYNNNYVNYNETEMKNAELSRLKPGQSAGLRLRTKEIFEREKILTRQTADEIIATLDNNNYYYANTIHGTTIIDNNYETKFVLGVMNSKAITWFYRNTIAEEGKTFAQIKIALLGTLPIPKISIDSQKKLISIVDTIMATGINPELLKALNTEVYSLFKLTQDEIKIVEES